MSCMFCYDLDPDLRKVNHNKPIESDVNCGQKRNDSFCQINDILNDKLLSVHVRHCSAGGCRIPYMQCRLRVPGGTIS